MKDFYLAWCCSFGNEHNLKFNMDVWVWLLSVCAPLFPFNMDGMEAGAGFIPMLTMNKPAGVYQFTAWMLFIVTLKKKYSGGKMPMSFELFLSIILLVSPALLTLVHWLHILAFYTRRNFPLTFSGNHCPFQNLNHTLFQTHSDWNQVITFKQKVVC